jgi:hypothetical protein
MAHEVGIGGDDYVCIGSAVQHKGGGKLRSLGIPTDPAYGEVA